MSSSYRSNRLDLSHWDPYAVRRGGCLEVYYCNMVEWFWWDWSLIFDDQLVSFSALTLLVWLYGLKKIVPEMTYYVSSGTLLTHSLTQRFFASERPEELANLSYNPFLCKTKKSRRTFKGHAPGPLGSVSDWNIVKLFLVFVYTKLWTECGPIFRNL